MTNLVEEFFKRDLSETEAQALEDLLETSSGDAMRFGAKLRGEYLSLGLPDPQTPSPSMATASHSLTWVKAFLLTAAFAGLAATAWRFSSKPAIVPIPHAVALPIITRHREALPPPPVAIPERLTSTAEGNRLSVVVELGKAAPVKVSILGPNHQTVRALYDGNLQPGKWSLHWDGLLDDGSKAPAGDYHIQVRSGSSEMSKTVSIE
jgi:hypothetical protein